MHRTQDSTGRHVRTDFGTCLTERIRKACVSRALAAGIVGIDRFAASSKVVSVDVTLLALRAVPARLEVK